MQKTRIGKSDFQYTSFLKNLSETASFIAILHLDNGGVTLLSRLLILHDDNIMKFNDFHLIEYKNSVFALHISSLQFYEFKRDSEYNKYFEFLRRNDISQLCKTEYKEIEQIINKSIHENSIEEEKYSKLKCGTEKFQSVMLPISAKCNLTCSYCFAQTENGFGFGDYNDSQAKYIVDFIMSNSIEKYPCQLNFFGGEPMLNFKIVECVVNYIEERYSNRRVNYSLTTNGTIFDDQAIQYIKDKNINLLVSIDGPENISPHRRYRNGKHSYSDVYNNIKMLIDSNVKSLQARATISSDCSNLVAIYDTLEQLNIPFAAVFAYKSINETELSSYTTKVDFLSNQFELLLDYYKNRILRKERINCYSIMQDINLIKNRVKRKYSCSARQYLFAITNDGSIFSCEHLAYDKNNAIGNIKQGINHMLNQTSPNVDDILGCESCWIRFLCCGGCFSSKGLNQQNAKMSDDDCTLKKIYYEFIIKLYSEIKHSNIL